MLRKITVKGKFLSTWYMFLSENTKYERGGIP